MTHPLRRRLRNLVADVETVVLRAPSSVWVVVGNRKGSVELVPPALDNEDAAEEYARRLDAAFPETDYWYERLPVAGQAPEGP